MLPPPLPPRLPPKLPPLSGLHMQVLGRAQRPSKVVILDHVGNVDRQPRVLAAEDIPGYHEYRGWYKAQQQLADEGVLLTYPVGHARLAAVEARRLANELLPFDRLPLSFKTIPLLPPRLP